MGAGDPDRGYQQLMREQLPIRKDQLFNLYGPQGAVPLIPGAGMSRRAAWQLQHAGMRAACRCVPRELVPTANALNPLPRSQL